MSHAPQEMSETVQQKMFVDMSITLSERAQQMVASEGNEALVGPLTSACKALHGHELPTEILERVALAARRAFCLATNVAPICDPCGAAVTSRLEALSALWEAVGGLAGICHDVKDVCKKMGGVVKPVHSMLLAAAEFAGMENLAPMGSETWDMLARVCLAEQLFRAWEVAKQGVAAGPVADEPADTADLKKVSACMAEIVLAQQGLAEDAARTALKQLLLKMRKDGHALEQVCRGGPRGQPWYEGFEGEILAVFRETLDKVDGKQISGLRTAAIKACLAAVVENGLTVSSILFAHMFQ